MAETTKQLTAKEQEAFREVFKATTDYLQTNIETIKGIEHVSKHEGLPDFQKDELAEYTKIHIQRSAERVLGIKPSDHATLVDDFKHATKYLKGLTEKIRPSEKHMTGKSNDHRQQVDESRKSNSEKRR